MKILVIYKLCCTLWNDIFASAVVEEAITLAIDIKEVLTHPKDLPNGHANGNFRFRSLVNSAYLHMRNLTPSHLSDD